MVARSWARHSDGQVSISSFYQEVLLLSRWISRKRKHQLRSYITYALTLLQVGAHTETELKEKKLIVEDALNTTKATIEYGIVVGGGCTLLRLASIVVAIKETLENDEKQVLATH